jgi:hypothetical protein
MNVDTITNGVFENIQREHDLLREQLGHIHRLLSRHDTPGDQIAAQLQHFHGELIDHFWNEQNDGFFADVVTQAPNLTTQARKLCAEHRAILLKVSELARFAAAGYGSEAWWRELKSRFQVFSKLLMRHESDENSLLQQAHQHDIGVVD